MAAKNISSHLHVVCHQEQYSNQGGPCGNSTLVYRRGPYEKGCEVCEGGDSDGEAGVLKRPRHAISWLTSLQVIQTLHCAPKGNLYSAKNLRSLYNYTPRDIFAVYSTL